MTPTRSARTPLVMGPWPRRLESPVWPATLPSGSGAADDPTTRDLPSRRADPAGPRRSACARPPARRPRRLATDAERRRRDMSLARTHPGPGPHPPGFREEARGPLHPRCLPPAIRLHPGAAEAAPRMVRAERAARRPDGVAPIRHVTGTFSTACCQAVENARRLLRIPLDPTALDGAEAGDRVAHGTGAG
jgi:hypothetical protein